ncbi:hypothetical protein OAE75_01745 [bacterium]|nr:hypothetical protein [bacterium]
MKIYKKRHRGQARTVGEGKSHDAFLGVENYFIYSVSLSCCVRFAFYLPFLIKIIRLKIFLFAEKVSNITCVSGFIGGAIATTVESADALRAGKAIGVYRLPTKG